MGSEIEFGNAVAQTTIQWSCGRTSEPESSATSLPSASPMGTIASGSSSIGQLRTSSRGLTAGRTREKSRQGIRQRICSDANPRVTSWPMKPLRVM